MGHYEEAEKKLGTEAKQISGQKEKLIASEVRDALQKFAAQDDEFAQAIVQGGSLQSCLTEVCRGVAQKLSDLEAYRRAASFYFPGSKVRFEMHIDLVGDAAEEEEPSGIVLDLADFL